jgi:hypothetical protein
MKTSFTLELLGILGYKPALTMIYFAAMDSKKETQDPDSGRQLLRHMLATLAYRARKPLSGPPAGFADFCASETTRTPGKILAHLGDLLDWALSLAKGKQEWRDSPPIAWDRGVARFYASLEALESYLASNAPLGVTPEKLFQGAIADSLTHVGQISLLRRLAGAPVRGENYHQAEIVAGRVGPEQAAPRREFE